MIPGVSSSSGTGDAIACGSGLDNNYVVDGVNITNTGFEAEYGQATGGLQW
jgi:hypothetical protein